MTSAAAEAASRVVVEQEPCNKNPTRRLLRRQRRPPQPAALCWLMFSIMLNSTARAWLSRPQQVSQHLFQQKVSSRTQRQQATTRLFSTAAATATAAAATTTASAVELQHVEFGRHDVETSAPPVVLLHGLLGNKKNFATVANSLSSQLEQKRRIYSVDLRNHGENHHDWRSDMSYPSMAEDVLQFLDRQAIDRAVIVGHSMGGKVAQALALLHPERCQGLCILDIAPVAYTSEDAHWNAVKEIIAVLRSVPTGIKKRQVDAQLRNAIPDPALRAFCLTNWDDKAGRWKIHIEAIAEQLDCLAGFDICVQQHQQQQQHHQFHGDSFFIHGGQSRFVRTQHMKTISQYFPNHLLTTIKGAGHWIHAEAPDDTTALLKRYLDR